MRIGFSRDWTIILRRDGGAASEPELFAVEELSRIFEKLGGEAPRIGGDGSGERLIILDCGRPKEPAARPRGFSWRAAPERIELYGDDPPALLRAVYDFLGSSGVSWPYPGEEGERLPPSGSAEPSEDSDSGSGSCPDGRPGCSLILGHGAYMERWDEYLLWAARNGYSSVFFHTTDEELALGAIPASAYESRRDGVAALARRLGLRIELGGHALSTLLPRRLFRRESELFRMVDGARREDGNLCPSNGRALEIVSAAFADFAIGHPEVGVFHVWPADLPEGGWCSCPDCAAAGLSPAAQSLKTAVAMARALAVARPGCRLSFLAYHDTENFDARSLGSLPGNLDLLWAPRRRSWAKALDDPDCELNAASAAAFRAASTAWRAAGGGAVAVFEYWEDALLFKGAVPPRPAALTGDAAVYAPAEGGADRIGILMTGGRLPLAPRPNPWLLPRIVAGGNGRALAPVWVDGVYGPAARAMNRYWEALEEAWTIGLDAEPGDAELQSPRRRAEAADMPPADWGDPWKASAERLAALRGNCEALFDCLRHCESALADAEKVIDQADRAEMLAFRGEQGEYRITAAHLELDCARLAVYHELASGEIRDAADLSLLAQAALDAYCASLASLPDKRSRRELRYLAFLFYGLRLRLIRRSASRNPLRRVLDKALCLALLAFRARPLRGAWDRGRRAEAGRRRLRST
ncbi:MAG TPA: hypothetical protein VMV90_08345 [Rectinemataceae bacterium]|nr:hypothetical protein [Rectinemataceae bacterium]